MLRNRILTADRKNVIYSYNRGCLRYMSVLPYGYLSVTQLQVTQNFLRRTDYIVHCKFFFNLGSVFKSNNLESGLTSKMNGS